MGSVAFSVDVVFAGNARSSDVTGHRGLMKTFQFGVVVCGLQSLTCICRVSPSSSDPRVPPDADRRHRGRHERELDPVC
ncbi:hypothetical protein GWI33_006345 [Rhynchophorus ferrugineus]|uniref:Uncharacterized protein n=1 Tax=Rhynchophorus ferrugineus TaxID=354439 RepID=A0A834MJ17_RHYFE|nr:hypothetical protein GWI33_006345 [Rhynchophorus ferrugineus]